MAQPDEPTARGYNEEEIRAAEEEFDALVNAGLVAAAAAAAAAVVAEPIAATVSDATIAPALTVWNTYVAEVLVPALTRIFKGSAAMFIDTAEPVLLALSYDLTDIAPVDEPATEWMRLASNRLRAVSDIVWEEIRQQLVEGVQAGDGIPELAQRVRDAAGFSEPRARATARTEVAAASNGGSITQARSLGLDMDKQWEATSPTDGRTRVTHLAAHHRTVPLGAKFVVGDDLLDFPGDPTGSAEEVINCRCAVTYLNIRRAEETPTVAAGFVEGQHPRDREGKFAETPDGDYLEIDDAMSQLGDIYSPVVAYWEWGTHTGAAGGIEGYASMHESGDAVLSRRDRETGELQVIIDGDDPELFRQIGADLDWAVESWRADNDEHEGFEDHDLIDATGDGHEAPLIGYAKNGDINFLLGDTDLWLDQDEAESLAAVLPTLADSIDDNPPETAAAFREPDHPRDREGKFAEKRGPGSARSAGPVSGEAALNSAPVRLKPDRKGHAGSYADAELAGLDDDDAKQALSEMEGLEYQVTNSYLRGNMRGDVPADVQARVDAVDRAMEASPLPEDVIVHRGIKDGAQTFGATWYGEFGEGTFEEQDEKWPRWEAGERPDLTGMEWQDLAYSHTTVKDERLGGYARKIVGLDPVAMNIRVPAGTGAVQMSGMDLEGELMLERGLRFRVVKDHGADDNGVRQWDVEVISNG